MFSKYLESRRELCRELVNRLAPDFEYISILGKTISGNRVTVTTKLTAVKENPITQSGFVAKLYNGKIYSEYSFTDITEKNMDDLERKIRESVCFSGRLLEKHVNSRAMRDEPLEKDFERKGQGRKRNIPEVIEELTAIKDSVHAVSDRIIHVEVFYEQYDVAALFVSKNRMLTQSYSWNSIYSMATARDGEIMQQTADAATGNDTDKVFEEMKCKAPGLGKLAVELLGAGMIEPGVYDIITTPVVTGLIAHEAFGHGVEMDMFVKQRAKARNYVGGRVASDLVNMHDGARAVESCVGYFFDDDGVLAQDTLVIRNGILQTGISDALSAMQLGTEPTGNGRREDLSRKSYSRMTNTFFAPGKDKLEDMIASVKHGYMLFEEYNGMEDPKNWNIQCVVQYGREIRDGKFTGKIVAPVVMSGYVPDLLQSISMVSDEWEVIGIGYCGKGYKEWIPVSDGGPYLKARCKLG